MAEYNFLIGESIEKAIDYLTTSCIPYRVSHSTNGPLLLTADYNCNRVNLKITDGVVTDISLG